MSANGTPGWCRWVWFVGLWLAGILAVAGAAYALRAVLSLL